MPYTRFEWHEHIKEVWGEYKSTRAAVDRLMVAVAATPDLLIKEDFARKHLNRASQHLEGTYIIRLFAAFEAALRSYDRARHEDPTRETKAAVLIDQIGGRRGLTIRQSLRDRAREVCRVRNFWAHDADAEPTPMTVGEAHARLQTFCQDFQADGLPTHLTK